MSGQEQQSPSYDALLVIAQSVGAALARAGVTDCDDPGEAIDVMRENLEARVAFLESERRRLQEAAPQPPAEAHCATCTCAPGMTPAVRFDASAAEREGAVRDHLVRMGWTPPAEAQAQGGGEVDLIARHVAKVVKNGDGFWKECSGCYETIDGHNVFRFPYSAAFGCNLGGGCGECGGLGAIWLTLPHDDATAPPSAPVGVEGESVSGYIDRLGERIRRGMAEVERFGVNGSHGRYMHDLAAEAIAYAAALEAAREDAHPDDAAVDAFTAAMKDKLAAARAKGRGGWNGDEPEMQQRVSDMLRAHVEKGDPRDVANFAMFLHQRGEAILPGQQPAAVDGGLIEAVRAMFDSSNTWPIAAKLEQLRRALAAQPGGGEQPPC